MAPQYIARRFKYSLVGLLSGCPTDSASQSELKSIIIIVLAHFLEPEPIPTEPIIYFFLEAKLIW